MSDMETDNMDEATALRDQEFAREFLDLIAEYVPGSYTLNQIRILQYIYLCSDYRGRPATHGEICRALRLSAPTVSRAIALFLETGMIQEQPDPSDGRRRLLLGERVSDSNRQQMSQRFSAMLARERRYRPGAGAEADQPGEKARSTD